MLRHIISVSLASLAMTACASLIPVKEVRDYSITYDDTELSLVQIVNPMGFNQPFYTPKTVLATYIFQVLESVVKDGKSDISATASYQAQRYEFTFSESL